MPVQKNDCKFCSSFFFSSALSRDKRPPNLTYIASVVGVEPGQKAPATGHELGQKGTKG